MPLRAPPTHFFARDSLFEIHTLKNPNPHFSFHTAKWLWSPRVVVAPLRGRCSLAAFPVSPRRPDSIYVRTQCSANRCSLVDPECLLSKRQHMDMSVFFFLLQFGCYWDMLLTSLLLRWPASTAVYVCRWQWQNKSCSRSRVRKPINETHVSARGRGLCGHLCVLVAFAVDSPVTIAASWLYCGASVEVAVRLTCCDGNWKKKKKTRATL